MKANENQATEDCRWVARAVVSSVAVVLLFLPTGTATVQSTCPEPDPVGNAYRSPWDGGQDGSKVTYTCFETYVHTAGDLERTCDASTGNYSGSPPVCTLNCSQPLTESASELVSLNDTMSLDTAIYACTGNNTGSDFPRVICADTLGRWNTSALDCQGPDNLILEDTVTMSPGGNNVSRLAIDGDDATYVSLSNDDVWSANLTYDPDSKKEISTIELRVKVNVPSYYLPCRYTSLGLEYVGTEQLTSKNKVCQAWSAQYPWPHPYNDNSYFPGDDDVNSASNYCRNPNATQGAPWCYTTDTGTEWEPCKVSACANLWMKITYLDELNREKSLACTDGLATLPRSILNAVDSAKTLTISCRNPATGRLPMGYMLSVEFESGAENVTLDLYEIKAYGHEYIAGCGSPLGYWGLELVSATLPSTLYSVADYRCRQGWHWRGGVLQAKCTASRSWLDPDLSQCTDEPNRASYANVTFDHDLESGNDLDIVDGDLSTCVQVRVNNTAFNLTLDNLVEIAEVIVTTEGSENHTASLHVEIVNPNTGQIQWSCSPLPYAGQNGTHLSTCTLRPISNTVRLWSEMGTDNGVSTWRICEVKVLGRVFTSVLECLQTERGGDYKGQWNLTLSGRTCQHWTSSTPHSNTAYIDPSSFPDDSLQDAQNFCRNPLDSSGRTRDKPWCYTTDPDKEWEVCPLFLCDKIGLLREDGADYKGDITDNLSDRPCEPWEWSANRPEQFDFMRLHYFSNTMRERRCRNPAASQSRPWCYVSRIPHVREYCYIPASPLVGQLSAMWIDPNNATSLPDWLTTNAWTVRECWKWYSYQFSVYRLIYLSQWLHCGDSPDSRGIFCDFIDHQNETRWIYFWFNCSFDEPEETTQITTQTQEPPATQTSSASPCPTSCAEVCELVYNVSADELQNIVRKIHKDLLVDTSKLSATIRKKESAPDYRPSAITTGCLGIVLVVVVIGVVISGDVINVIRFFSDFVKSRSRTVPKAD